MQTKIILFISLILSISACTGKKAVEANLLGLEYTNSRNVDTLRMAIRQFDLALEHQPEDHILYANKARAYIKLNNYDSAFIMLRKATSINTNYVDGLIIQAFLHEKNEDLTAASKLYKDVIDLYDKEIENNDLVSFRISKASIYYYLEGKEAAESELDQILQQEPGNAHALLIKQNINEYSRNELIDLSLGL